MGQQPDGVIDVVSDRESVKRSQRSWPEKPNQIYSRDGKTFMQSRKGFRTRASETNESARSWAK